MLADAFQNTHLMRGLATIAAQVNVRRVRPDHRDGLEFGEVERQQVAGVLQQHNCLLRGFEREPAVLGTVSDALGVGGIDVRVVQQSQAELVIKDSGNRAVNLPFGHAPGFHLIEPRTIDGSVPGSRSLCVC